MLQDVADTITGAPGYTTPAQLAAQSPRTGWTRRAAGVLGGDLTMPWGDMPATFALSLIQPTMSPTPGTWPGPGAGRS